MKKILIILLAILCIPISSYAISLSTLENNTQRYFKVYENDQFAMYLDTQSVESIQYAPPYYTLGANMYFVRYSTNELAEFSLIYNYDYTYSLESKHKQIIKNMKQNGEALDDNVIKTKLENILQDKEENSGIEYSSVLLSFWDLNGHLIQSINSYQAFPEFTKIKYLTQGYLQAELIFYTCYNQLF